MINEYLECAQAVSTHGVRGTLRLENRTNSPESLARLRTMYIKDKDGSFRPMKVIASSVQKNMVLATFSDITDLNEAITYKGTVFYAHRNDIKLGKDEHFIADMLGLNVYDFNTDEKYGTLDDVIAPAGRDIYVVSDINGGQFMIPVVKEFVKNVITEGDDAGIYVSLIEGMRE